jgi:anti-sigma regulatory factor (Ser/Thr protein kinase)
MATSVGSMTSLRLPSVPASVPVARRRLQDWLDHIGVRPDRVEDARVIVSEMVANSVRHARPLPDGTILVAWRLEDGKVELSVTDGGADTRPRRVQAPASAATGRGMAIVDVLADDWRIERTPTRSTLHTRLSV